MLADDFSFRTSESAEIFRHLRVPFPAYLGFVPFPQPPLLSEVAYNKLITTAFRRLV